MVYTVKCASCGKTSDVFVHTYDAKLTCPNCGSESVTRQFGQPGLIFKGEGFYVTDYKRKGKER